MSDIKVDLYKKNVEAAVDRWKGKLAKIGAKADKIRETLAPLRAIKSPSADDKKRIEHCEKAFAALGDEVDTATTEMKLDIASLDIPKEAPKAELDKLPDWLKAMIKAKGIPLGKGVSVVPSVEFDFKHGTLKTLGVTVHW